VLAQTSHWAGDVPAAIAHANRAIELNGNFAVAHFYLGIGLSLNGRHEEALDAIETGWRLSPRDPRASTWLANKARVFYHLRRYEEAIETALSARRIRPHAYGFLVLVASYAQLGRDEEEGRWPISTPCQRAAKERHAGIWTAMPTRQLAKIWPTACARPVC
jgi:tetratricopeptide (TPR) repeat protein